jgi:hypothetical protein
LNQLLPRQADNGYHGHKFALWLFAVVVILKVIMSLNSIFNGRVVATSADGIPLDTFTPAAAQTVVALFAIWAIAQLIICLLCIVVLARYRAMIPLMFGLLLLEHLGRKLILAGHAHCQDWNTARLRREPGAPRSDRCRPGAVAVEPTGIVRVTWRCIPNSDVTAEAFQDESHGRRCSKRYRSRRSCMQQQ